MLVTYMGQDCKHNTKILLSSSIRLKIEFCSQTRVEVIQFLVASELDSYYIQKESSSKEWKLKAKTNIKTHQVSSKVFTHEKRNNKRWEIEFDPTTHQMYLFHARFLYVCWSHFSHFCLLFKVFFFSFGFLAFHTPLSLTFAQFIRCCT